MLVLGCLHLDLKFLQAALGRLESIMVRRKLLTPHHASCLSLLNFLRGLGGSVDECRQPKIQFGHPAAHLLQILLKIGGKGGLVIERRLFGGNPLFGVGQPGFLSADGFIVPRELCLQLTKPLLPGLCLSVFFVEAAAEGGQGRFFFGKTRQQLAIFLQTQSDSQFPETAGMFLVFLCLGCLNLDAAQLLFDLVDDVLQAQQILVDAFELAQAFSFLGFEPADAGGFLENRAAGPLWKPATERRPGPVR